MLRRLLNCLLTPLVALRDFGIDKSAGRISTRRRFRPSVECLEARDVPSSTTFYFNDFENGLGAAWSSRGISATPVGARHFHGEFSNHVETLRLDQLATHNTFTVSFKLFVLKSWDGSDTNKWGPDRFQFDVTGGPRLLDTTFSNQPLPSPGAFNSLQAFSNDGVDGLYPAFSGASEVNTLGYTFYRGSHGRVEQMDSVYEFSFTFDHAGGAAAFNFRGLGLQSIGDESWGVDDVRVTGDTLPQISVEATDPSTSATNLDTGAFTIRRNGATDEDLSVYLATSGTAVAGRDYDPLPDVVTIPAGQSSVILAVTPLSNLLNWGTRTVDLAIAGDVNYRTIAPSRASLAIAGNSLGTPLLRIEATDAAAVDSGDDAMFTLFRSGGLSQSLTEALTIRGSAVNGVDYERIPETATFAPGQDKIVLAVHPLPQTEIKGVRTIEIELDPNNGFLLAPGEEKAKAQIVDGHLSLRSVAYSGDGVAEVVSDRDGKAFAGGADQWRDDSMAPNGNASDEGDVHAPVAYVRETKVAVQASFYFDPAKFKDLTKIKVRGTGPNGEKFAETAVAEITQGPAFNDIVDFGLIKTKGEGKLKGFRMKAAAVADKPLEDTIKLYKTYAIKWEVYDGAKWVDVGTSDNKLYVVLAKPKADKLFESVIDIAVRNADGKKDAVEAVDAIWKDFKDHVKEGVKRKDIDGLNRKDGASMKYWIDNGAKQADLDLVVQKCRTLIDMLNGEGQTVQLLKNVGTCEAWASLFQSTIAALGIDGADVYVVTPNNAITGGNNVRGYGLMVKTFTFGNADAQPDGIFTHTYKQAAVRKEKDVPAQGNPNPPGIFFNHFVVEFTFLKPNAARETRIYDPSYGTGFFTSETAWENASLDGFIKVSNGRAKPNDPNVKEVDFSKR